MRSKAVSATPANSAKRRLRVFKTEPLYPPAEGDESDQGFMASLIAFFTSLWNPAAAPAENLGFIYIYDEDGTLLGETGTGGANSGGEAFYLWLPTANGPLPVMMISGISRYAIHADHLNTPRRLTEWNGNLAWLWAYSAFGDAQPTVADRRFASVAPALGDFEFNLRYPGQTADKESGLFYNYFRSYSPMTGRYTQSDPIGLDGGWNRFGYVSANPLRYADSRGLCPMCLALPVLGGGITLGDIGIGAAIGGALLGLDRIFNDAAPPRGLPPEGVRPPIPEADQCKPGPASRPSERDKGGQSLWDPNGGEWRWFPGDKWHNPHWDHNAHDGQSSPWVNVPHGGLPPVKK